MTFSYDISQLSTPLNQARLEIGDVSQDAGPLPGGGNLQDEEIQFYLDAYDGDINSAVARCFELLAARWSSRVDYTLGPLTEKSSQVASSFTKKAAEYWAKVDKAKGTYTGAVSVPLVRDDGYSNNLPAGTLFGPSAAGYNENNPDY